MDYIIKVFGITTINAALANPCAFLATETNQIADVFKVYPNPTSGLVNITLPMVTNQVDVAVYDLFGKIIYAANLSKQDKVQSMTMDLSHLSSGIYILHIVTDSKTTSRKLILNK
jgi:hypothetical protein